VRFLQILISEDKAVVPQAVFRVSVIAAAKSKANKVKLCERVID
jgi:hypothetical protein